MSWLSATSDNFVCYYSMNCSMLENIFKYGKCIKNLLFVVVNSSIQLAKGKVLYINQNF